MHTGIGSNVYSARTQEVWKALEAAQHSSQRLLRLRHHALRAILLIYNHRRNTISISTTLRQFL